MLKVGFIGVGNTGNQIASLAQERIENLPVVAINSSQKDLDTIPETVKKFMITDKKKRFCIRPSQEGQEKTP